MDTNKIMNNKISKINNSKNIKNNQITKVKKEAKTFNNSNRFLI